ncbi:hypothetical protein EV191_101981 [Tamaricihabitans halophyticus]|uniref:Dolichyl-phosphate-mannose-protein mannosyltransferase n=1 Tax=Tamaricihabitans halophyticus TaxID=1262583 RepID=A0A4R2R5G2_9PSEU|nr:DUF6541 family protein [Tamaricihabitans halophyticus]TCP57029.1 hypothetical protein EV191_101981 [Tamaricihabitans halophyticus]
MPENLSVLSQASTIIGYLLVLFLPGLLAGFAAGLRGWVLAGVSPLLTCAIAGLTGPWLALLGGSFGLLSFTLATLLTAAICAGLRLATDTLLTRRGYRRPPWPTPWTRGGHLALLGCVLLAAGIGLATVLRGIGKLNAIPQGFDAVMHGNGIRYIADTGDGGLFGLAKINWYDDGSFYPNAYHLIGALVYELTGQSVPAAINANTVLIPGLLGLSLVVLVRQFRGRLALACITPLIAVAATSATYESMYRGPLLPFVFGLALTPIAAVLLQRFLQRPGLDTGFCFALGAAGLLAVHSSTLFGAMLFCLPMLVQRWLTRSSETTRPRRFGWELLLILAVAIAGGLLAAPHLFGALALAGGDYPYAGWDAVYSAGEAIWRLVSFQHVWDYPQWALFGLLVLGVLSCWKLRELAWLVGSAVLGAVFFVYVAADDAEWVKNLSRPWWNDRFRLIALAMLALCPLAAHGLAELQRWLTALVRRLRKRRVPAVPALVGTGLVATLVLSTGWLYLAPHANSISEAYQRQPGEEMAVSPEEVEAFRVLRTLVGPDEWVLNERPDGSAWMYALVGIRPIAGHYDGSMPPKDQQVLSQRFRDYRSDPEVRRIIAKRNIHYVMLSTGTIPDTFVRSPGYVSLYRLPFLDEVYRNSTSVIYRIDPAGAREGNDR